MVLPIVFALGALVCAALNDIVFRKYASLRLSVGWYVSTIGFSWALLQLLLDLAAAGSPRRMHVLQPWRLHTLMWAPALALVLALANILLIEALAGVDASAGSTIYRLNTVGVVLGGWVLLGEQLRAAQIAGVAAGVAAIMLLYLGSASEAAEHAAAAAGFTPPPRRRVYRRPKRAASSAAPDYDVVESILAAADGAAAAPAAADVERGARRPRAAAAAAVKAAAEAAVKAGAAAATPRLYYAVAVVAAVLRAAYGLLSKRALAGGADSEQLVLAAGIGWGVAGAAYALLREGAPALRARTLSLGVVNGALQLGNIACLTLALEGGAASVVVPIANCSFALTVAISIGSGMELVKVRKLAAVVAALAAVILLGIAAEQDAADAERRGKHGKGRLLHMLL